MNQPQYLYEIITASADQTQHKHTIVASDGMQAILKALEIHEKRYHTIDCDIITAHRACTITEVLQ